MRKLLFFLLVVTLVAGCSSPDKQYVVASQKAFAVIVPEYTGYIEADTTLDDLSKQVRIKTAKEALKMANEEKKRIEK